MFKSIKRIREEKGFTLIELLVVILIIGILIAIAAPSFLGQQDKAHESETKQQLALVYKTAKAEAASAEGTFPSAANLVLAVEDSEPQLDCVVSVDPDADTDTDVTTDEVPEGEIYVEVVGGVLTAVGNAQGDNQFTLTANESSGAYSISAPQPDQVPVP